MSSISSKFLLCSFYLGDQCWRGAEPLTYLPSQQLKEVPWRNFSSGFFIAKHVPMDGVFSFRSSILSIKYFVKRIFQDWRCKVCLLWRRFHHSDQIWRRGCWVEGDLQDALKCILSSDCSWCRWWSPRFSPLWWTSSTLVYPSSMRAPRSLETQKSMMTMMTQFKWLRCVSFSFKLSCTCDVFHNLGAPGHPNPTYSAGGWRRYRLYGFWRWCCQT